MSVNLIEHYLAVFNPYPSKTQQQLVMRLRHLTNGAPVLAERVASALEAIAHYSTTGTPILYNDVVEYAYIRLHDHALELQSAGMVLSVVDAHRHLRSVLFEFVDELNTLYTALPIAESIKDECA